jgi:phosphoenolpyruvate phosphomutase
MNKILVSAGDAITAKLIEETGFDGIWISGFEASARLGLPDNGSITMTEMLNIARPIVRAVKIPVYVDVDTGYGNFCRTVSEFENIGVAGLSVEDNVPHKCNSLWGGKTELLSIEEFSEKLTVKRKSIELIARTEALIRGYGFEEAFKRAKRYSELGANYVLIHTRDTTGKEAKEIAQNKSFDTPLAIVPTKFPQITNTELFNLGYSMVIWANQTERVKIKAIREALALLKETDSAEKLEKGFSVTLDDMRSLCPLD